MTPISDLELNCLSIFVTLWPKNPNVSVWHQYWKTQFSGPMRKNKLAPPLFLHCGIKTLTKNTIWVALGLKTKKSSDFDHGTDFRRSTLLSHFWHQELISGCPGAQVSYLAWRSYDLELAHSAPPHYGPALNHNFSKPNS